MSGQPLKPFLKWPGRKTALAKQISEILPHSSRLIEPFAGSCAVFLAVERERYLLADSNADVIALYRLLAADPKGMTAACEPYFDVSLNNAENYYILRARLNSLLPGNPERAAIFVYLNLHGFNGLIRYTRRAGNYNVQFGCGRPVRFPREDMMSFGLRAGRAEFLLADFRQTIAMAVPGDVIYCDPPYVHVAASKGYHLYGGLFRISDQRDLAEAARSAAERGVPVLLSNHDTPIVRDLYEGASFTHVSLNRKISCKPSTRKNAEGEVLALYSARKTGWADHHREISLQAA
jgi:DNA adenine methylase